MLFRSEILLTGSQRTGKRRGDIRRGGEGGRRGEERNQRSERESGVDGKVQRWTRMGWMKEGQPGQKKRRRLLMFQR